MGGKKYFACSTKDKKSQNRSLGLNILENLIINIKLIKFWILFIEKDTFIYLFSVNLRNHIMVQKPALLSMRSVIVYPALTRILNRCQSVTGVENINMEKDVGSLQDEALKRKDRLKALREKQRHVRTDGLLF